MNHMVPACDALLVKSYIRHKTYFTVVFQRDRSVFLRSRTGSQDSEKLHCEKFGGVPHCEKRFRDGTAQQNPERGMAMRLNGRG